MKKIGLVFILLSLLLVSCGTFEIYVETTPSSESAMPAVEATTKPHLSLSSTSEEIQRLMLESATKWKSVWMDGTITDFAMSQTDSQTTTTREQVWVDLTTNRFRILTGPMGGEAEKLLSSDGLTILEMDLKTGQSQSRPLPEMPQEKQFVPTLQPGFAYPQPLWGQMGTPLSQLAFASDFAQNEGTFKPVGIEMIAGREALVVEWTHAQNELPSWKMWLDTKTAIILKMQNFNKEGGDSIRNEVTVNQVSFDDIFANSLFKAPSALPQFSDKTGLPLNPREPAPTASSDPDPLKDVYFFIMNPISGHEKTQLVRVPGSCVAGLSPCPQAEVIEVPSNLNFSLSSLAWSPSGDRAAFAIAGTQPDEQARLSLFDPETKIWTSLAEFNFIDPPMWSADGEWLAFRVQDGLGKDEIYLIRRDGTELTNVSTSGKFPDEGQPYALHGWSGNQMILHGRNDKVYLMRAEDGKVTSLFDTSWAKAVFVPSPDGYFLAYLDPAETQITLKLLTPDGKAARDLASFEHASLYPIVWSPDGTRLAFAKMTNQPTDGEDIYIIDSDGRNLKQIYHSDFASVYEMSFSPDGNYLLFQDDDAAGRHIFSVDLTTLQTRLVQVPDVPLDWWWLAPSWQR